MTAPFTPVSALGASSLVGTIPGLSDDERYTLNQMWLLWTRKLRRNIIRSAYYDQKNLLKDLGIAIPPHLTSIEMALGWPAKAVDVLARRLKLEQFITPGTTDDDPLGIRRLWRDNDMDLVLPQTLTSALIHSCAFMMVTKGDTTAGEPEVLISAQSAMFGAGLWDYRLRRLKAAFAVTNMDKMGRVVEFALFLPHLNIRGIWDDGQWDVQRFVHTSDRLPVEVLPYKPSLDRPFGSSRISRAVMSHTDSALRTLFRLEISAEFYSSPQRWIMGADESMFVDSAGNVLPQWQAIMGRIWAAGRDDDGQIPTVGQFNAASPLPHTEQLKSYAAMLASETSLPLGELGIVQHNPSSAEAIAAAERGLVTEAKYAMDSCFGPRLVRVMQTALQIRDGWDTMPDNVAGLDVRWSAPENTPASAAGDFIVKLLTAYPGLANSAVPLEKLEWSQSDIDRAMADMRKANASVINKLLTQPQADAGKPAGATVPTRPGNPTSQ